MTAAFCACRSRRGLRRSLLATTLLVGLTSANAALAQTEAPPAASEPQASAVDDVVVTANRREQRLSRVPASIEAFSEERLERETIRDFADLAAATPGLRFSQSNLGSTSITIRGISSGSGAATTGLYIDDTPVQARGMGNSAAGFTPSIFDLQRVEVLRGPQGTLFGDSAMGGAVRFITPEASLYDSSGYSRAETSMIDGGGLSYEAGFAMGGPIIEGKLGFRGSAYFRHAGGWIDRMAGTVAVVSPNGAAGPLGSLSFNETGLYAENTNSVETTALRLALQWAPMENLRIKPAVHFENRDSNDVPLYFWPMLSDPGASRYVRPVWLPSVDATHRALPEGAPTLEPGTDQFILPSLNIEWDLGPVDFVSTTSYFDRDQESISDYTTTYIRLFGNTPVPGPGDYAYVTFGNTQKIFTQEFRLQSANSDSRLRWVAGAFYSTNKQTSEQAARPNFVMSTVRAPGVANGAPFGPGYSAYMNYYGEEPVDSVTYYHLLTNTTDQLAAFGQIDYKVTEKLTLTAGLRYSSIDLGYEADYAGPNNNLNQPRGLACLPGTGRSGIPCSPVAVGQYKPGEGPFAPAYASTSDSGGEKPFTPKISIAYQHDPDNLFYGTVARGFRVGGAQARVAGTCRDELISFGFLDGNSPEVYESDTVTSYELGAKNRLFDGRLSIDAAVFRIEWEDIQTNTSLTSCGLSFIRNGTGATSKGFDLNISAEPMDGLSLGLMIGYQDAYRNETEIINNRVLSTKGAPIGGYPLQMALSGQYEFSMADGREAYARLDYQYTSKGRKPDTGAASYDAMIPRTPETHTINGRVGVYLGDVNLYAFATNLLNDDTYTVQRSINTPIYGGYGPRPRTVGLGLSRRF